MPPGRTINFKQARARLRPFADASTEWLDNWIPHTTNRNLLKLLLQERRRRRAPPTH